MESSKLNCLFCHFFHCFSFSFSLDLGLSFCFTVTHTHIYAYYNINDPIVFVFFCENQIGIFNYKCLCVIQEGHCFLAFWISLENREYMTLKVILFCFEFLGKRKKETRSDPSQRTGSQSIIVICFHFFIRIFQ